ncbi:hypothetical protein HBH61_176730 [Parastagonospora nodorum]|nr:hypothetical protein HBI03_200710 [Parastagonospora nodorum]KAH4291289.1 hypothetical protein HBI01_192450 [Parastagonospora nodorum]KAH4804417.1 hypothetical protein HBH61_176730 [Parastagonospora nodorum]
MYPVYRLTIPQRSHYKIVYNQKNNECCWPPFKISSYPVIVAFAFAFVKGDMSYQNLLQSFEICSWYCGPRNMILINLFHPFILERRCDILNWDLVSKEGADYEYRVVPVAVSILALGLQLVGKYWGPF